MSKEKDLSEMQAYRFRSDNGLTPIEPIHVKSLLRKLGIHTFYRPLSEYAYGLSVKSPDGKMFILVNSNTSRGRQHFTIAHELYHLFFDEEAKPHLCHDENGNKAAAERKADLFASNFLLPRLGVLNIIPEHEWHNNVSVATILRLEQYYQVSHRQLLIRLQELGILDKGKFEEYAHIGIKQCARAYGYDLSLYEKGNNGTTISDFGEKARLLFERERISEGHYLELLSMIGINGTESE